MSGVEITAVGVAARGAAAIGKSLQGDESEKAAILEASKESPGYKVAGAARGDRMAAKQLAINKIFSPLFWFSGYRREYFQGGGFAEDLGKKLEDIPEEELTAPSQNVAAQAIAGLSYSLDEPELKEMYLNLLATASQSDRKGKAHPSFSEIVRQLSQEEARFLPEVLYGKQWTTIEIRVGRREEAAKVLLLRHVIELTNPDTGVVEFLPEFPIYVDNWVRLGLITADYDRSIAVDREYDWAKTNDTLLSYEKLYSHDAERQVDYAKGVLQITAYGMRFADAVLPGNGRT